MNIGKAVKTQRVARNLSIRELASKTNLSPSAISKIENNKTIPNVITMKNIANALKVSVSYFFIDEEEHLVELVKKKDRPTFTRNHSDFGKVTEEILSIGKESQMQPCIITFPKGGDSGDAISHNGEEFTYVLKGKLLCILDGITSYELEEGDNLYFPSTIPHQWKNLSDTEEAKIMVVATPASF